MEKMRNIIASCHSSRYGHILKSRRLNSLGGLSSGRAKIFTNGKIEEMGAHVFINIRDGGNFRKYAKCYTLFRRMFYFSRFGNKVEKFGSMWSMFFHCVGIDIGVANVAFLTTHSTELIKSFSSFL